MMDVKQLSPCPICGGGVMVLVEIDAYLVPRYIIECENIYEPYSAPQTCDYHTGTYDTEDKVIARHEQNVEISNKWRRG